MDNGASDIKVADIDDIYSVDFDVGDTDTCGIEVVNTDAADNRHPW